MNSIYLAVDKDGSEIGFEKEPHKENFVGRWQMYNIDWGVLPLPKGTIKTLIGRELTWDDEPVEYKGTQK